MARGFTLIELMIAMSIGLVICAGAFTAVRVCAGATTMVNRLSLENSLMREGVAAALHDLDFWTSLDDPSDPAEQPLRAAPGNPFKPVSLDRDFSANDPKNWWRGLGCSFNKTDFGVYGIFSRIDHPVEERRRLATFYRTAVDQMGYYALCDYAPADYIYGYFDESYQNPWEFGGQIRFDAGYTPGDFMMLTDDHAFVLTRDPNYLAAGINWRQLRIWDGFTGTQGELYRLSTPLRLMADRPENWPDLDVQVRHFTAAHRQWHSATVLLASPLSGTRQKLYFTTTATTLRGARMQRHRDGGWATPTDPTLDD